MQGGAETYDKLLIQELENKGVKVCKFNSGEFSLKHLKLYNEMGFVFLVSNFFGLKAKVLKFLQSITTYCILEHDHKYIKSNNNSDSKSASVKL